MENLTLPPRLDSDRLSQDTDTTDSLSPMYPSMTRRGTHPVFFPDQMDLSALFTTTPTEALETKVRRLCNKQFVSRMSWSGVSRTDGGDTDGEDPPRDYDEYDMDDIWRKLGRTGTRDVVDQSITEECTNDDDDDAADAADDDDSSQYQSPWLRSLSRSISHHVDSRTISRERMRTSQQATSYGGKLYRTDERYGGGYGYSTERRSRCDVVDEHERGDEDAISEERKSEERPRVKMTEDEMKHAVVKLRDDMIKLRTSDRKLLKQFIQIRFGMEYLDWSRRKDQGSCLDLSAQCTLPRTPISPIGGATHIFFRKRAQSLAGNTPGYSTFAGRASTIKEAH